MRKCRNCLCHACIHVCDDCQKCHKANKKCNWYSGHKQLSFLEPPPDEEYSEIARRKWSYYGISKKRYKQLIEYIQSGRYASLASQAAHRANEMLSSYIILSIEKNLSYEGLQRLWELREIERMPCCRTDFYGYRRYFYYLLNKKIKEMGK